MRPSILIQAWQAAAHDLGVRIETPFVLILQDGEKVHAHVLVKDFGPTLVGTEAEEEVYRRLDKRIAAEGYGWSASFGDDLPYDREYFVEILKDWGWAGPKEQRPTWYAP